MSKYSSIENGSRATLNEPRTPFNCGGCLALLKRRYLRTHKCIILSKAALFILVWVFLAHLTFWFTSSGYAIVVKELNLTSSESINFYFLNISTLSYLFYPLAGYLADIKFGRFVTILRGTYSLIIFFIIFSIMLLPILYLSHQNLPGLPLYFLTCILSILCLLVITAFAIINANFIQFGIDQLHDSPEGHQSLFIYWYSWTIQVTLFISQATQYYLLTYTKPQYFLITFFPLIVLLIGSLYIIKKRTHYFIDNARLNPYRLICNVTKFARRHKVPIRRSAFTFCEDRLPSGLDLGMDKYGGPFTMEQVEDVKAFYGILKVLLSLGPVCALNDIKRLYAVRNDKDFYNSSITYELIVVMIPLYVCLVRPFIHYYLPRMLKRIGLGTIVNCLYLLGTLLLIEIAVHALHGPIKCPFALVVFSPNSTRINSYYDYFMIVPKIGMALSILLVQISLYEFICSQSPNSMKGFLIGLSFAISGILQTLLYGLLAVVSQVQTSYLNCGNIYFFLCVCLALIKFLDIHLYCKKVSASEKG